MSLSRRNMLAGAAALPALAGPTWTLAADEAKAPASKLIMLGTGGGPAIAGPRYETSHVIVCGEDAYVVDCGYGVTEQLVRAKVPLSSIRDIFITHHHPDHNIELGTLIYFAWYMGLTKPLDVYAGPPVKKMIADYLAAEKPDIDIWVKDIGHTPMPPIRAHERVTGGFVMQDKNVKVTCALVNHPPVFPAFGYRFDMADRSIVFSGDTSPLEAVAELAKGADILVHEALYMRAVNDIPETSQTGARRTLATPSQTIDPKKLREHLLKSHSPPDQVGRIAQEAGVKTLVLSHLVPAGPDMTDEMWRDEAAKYFNGEIIVAHDLMVL